MSKVDNDAYLQLAVDLTVQNPLPWRIVVTGDLPCLPMVAKQRGQVPVGQILVRRLRKILQRRSFFGDWSRLALGSQEYQRGHVGPQQWVDKASDTTSLKTCALKMVSFYCRDTMSSLWNCFKKISLRTYTVVRSS